MDDHLDVLPWALSRLRQRTSIWQRVKRVIALVWDSLLAAMCEAEGHGPFTLPVASTADSSPAPDIFCLNCGAKCSDYFTIEKHDGALFIFNRRSVTVVLMSHDQERIISPRGHVRFQFGGFHDHFGRAGDLSAGGATATAPAPAPTA